MVMKLVHITFHFEYADAIERIVDRHGVEDFVRYPMVDSKDVEGKHYGTQVFPGNAAVIQAQVPDEKVEPLLEDLGRFREEKRAHRHLQALVLPIESRLL